MQLANIDLFIIGAYLVSTVLLGFYISRLAKNNIQAYFLGGNRIPWWALGVSNASGMFDITGTMWLVSMCFVYGLKSAWLPWIWPVFNQIFLMVYLSAWLRRSNAMTGAEWMATRFGNTLGMRLSHGIVVVFALISAIGFIAYAFKGIGKFVAIFMPWELAPDIYAIIVFAVTLLYVIKGGMFSVVLTELLQFTIMTVAAIAVGVIAINQVDAVDIANATPPGWADLSFSWQLALDWSGIIDSVNHKINQDGFTLFGLFFMMMLFKGFLSSMAGPVPGYDMQRILACKDGKEAAKMSGIVSLVMLFPRYMMVAGLTVLALVFLGPDIQNGDGTFDFEQVLPYAISNFIPVGLSGLLLAGLLAAFMSTFAATVNSAPAYFVNDVYRRYLKPDADDKHYVRLSYLVSLVLVVIGVLFGLLLESINDIMQWIFGALFGGYAAANLLKWHWWRFNAYGYFFGMLAGLIASLVLPLVFPHLQPLYAFPYLLMAGLFGSLAGTLLTPADDIETLCEFYRTVRPWGCWGPIRKRVEQQNPQLKFTQSMRRDLANVAIGIIWQTTLVVAPIYLIIQEYTNMGIALFISGICMLVLKKTWYNKLEA